VETVNGGNKLGERVFRNSVESEDEGEKYTLDYTWRYNSVTSSPILTTFIRI